MGDWLRELFVMNAMNEHAPGGPLVSGGVFESGFAIVSAGTEFRLVPLSPTVSQNLASAGRRGVGAITVTFSLSETQGRH